MNHRDFYSPELDEVLTVREFDRLRELSFEEKEAARHLLGHYNYAGGWKAGSFTTKLIELLERADQSNKERLFMGFPEMRYPVWIMQTQGGPALQRLLGVEAA